MKSVVVTGASTGIGWGCVKVLIAAGFRVFGSVRRQEDAERLRKAFGPNCVPLLFDVTDAAAVEAAAGQVETMMAGETLSGLVNNAGIAVAGPLLHLRPQELAHQLDVNLIGPLVVTQAFAPLLGTDRSRKGSPGRIVMISSISGRNGFPFLGAYCASKFALEGLSEALRRELMLFGIDVVVIGPGAVATPIWDKAEQADITPFLDTPYAAAIARMKDLMVSQGRGGLPPERLGRVVLTALTARRPKTRYAVNANPLVALIGDSLPRRMVDAIIARQLGFGKRPAPR